MLSSTKHCAQLLSCPTLCDFIDCSPPGSSVHGILQARILEWGAIPFSRGSSRPRDRTQVSHIAGRFFTIWAIREVSVLVGYLRIFVYNLLGKMALCQGTDDAGLLWMRWQDVLWGMRRWCSWEDDVESTGVSWRQSFCLHHCFFCGILPSKSVLTSPAFSTSNASLCISRIFSGCCCLWLHSALSFLTESCSIETKHCYWYFWIVKTSSCTCLFFCSIFITRKKESESELAQSCPTLSDPMDCSLPGSSVHGIFPARVLEWGAIAFSRIKENWLLILDKDFPGGSVSKASACHVEDLGLIPGLGRFPGGGQGNPFQYSGLDIIKF